MSTPELPEPALPEFVGELFSTKAYYTADQMREMYRAGRLAGLEEATPMREALAHVIVEAGTHPGRTLGNAACVFLASQALRPIKPADEFATSIRSLKEKQG